MAVVKRRGKWVADVRDVFNVRRWVTCETKAQAEVAEAGIKLARKGQTTAPTVDPDIKLAAYAARFLGECAAREIAPKTIKRYEAALRLHLVPRLGTLRVRDVTRPVVKDLLVAKLGDDAASFQGSASPRRAAASSPAVP